MKIAQSQIVAVLFTAFACSSFANNQNESPESFILAGFQNRIDFFATNCLVVGGGQNIIWRVSSKQPTGWVGCTIGGGWSNRITTGVAGVQSGPNYASTIAGGVSNSASWSYATIGGGYKNEAGYTGTVAGGWSNSAGPVSTVGGGAENRAVDSSWCFIGGGYLNLISGGLSADFATISGGTRNLATNAKFSSIGGGEQNRTLGSWATVAGGLSNSAASRSFVGGGTNNNATGQWAVVVGGDDNLASATNSTVGGGYTNTATGVGSTIGGGQQNRAGGIASAVPGGKLNNAAAHYTFAAGFRAKANHQGAFVYADSQNADFASLANNSFSVRALGGVRFASGASVGANQTVSWAPGSGAWSFTSDAATKESFRAVDAREVLKRVADLPVKEWNYIGYSDQRHIGPTAQDWHAAFPLNQSDTTINTADLHGVSLAAIKGLVEELKERDSRIASLEAKAIELELLKTKLQEMEERLESLPPAP